MANVVPSAPRLITRFHQFRRGAGVFQRASHHPRLESTKIQPLRAVSKAEYGVEQTAPSGPKPNLVFVRGAQRSRLPFWWKLGGPGLHWSERLGRGWWIHAGRKFRTRDVLLPNPGDEYGMGFFGAA